MPLLSLIYMAFGRLITVVGVCLLAAAGLFGCVEWKRVKGTTRATISSAAKRVAATSARRGLNVRFFRGDVSVEYIFLFLFGGCRSSGRDRTVPMSACVALLLLAICSCKRRRTRSRVPAYSR